MGAVGLGAFTEGLQGGIAARDEMDRNRAFKEYMRQRNEQGAINLQETYDARLAQWKASGADPKKFEAENTRYQKMQDPALIRFGHFLGDKMRGWFGGGGEEQGAMQQADFSSPQVQPAGLQASGAMTYGIPDQYADGGTVGRGRNRRPAPNDEEVPVSGGGIGAFMGDLGRNAKDLAMSGFQNTRDAWNDAGRLQSQDWQYMTEPGISATERGDRARSYVGDSIGGLAKVGAGFADDAMGPIDEWAGQAWDFAKGMVGMDSPEDKAAAAKSTGIPQPGPAPDEKAAAAATVDAPKESDGQIAQQAMHSGQQQAIENFDYKLLVDQGVSPEDLPSMTTQDWSDYRREMMDSLMARGANPKEALQQVDYMTVDTQMRGFQREGQKALLYLQSGQNREAAMALRQAYQYFPNGVGVKFGTANDPKTGQPAIIAMGVDEKTGKPSGTPMLITTERLNAMMENMSNPQAFRAWTKDGRDLQLKINQLQSEDDYRQGMLGVAQEGAISDRMKAQAAQAAAVGKGGMKPSDVDRRSDDYRKWASDKELMGEYEQGVAITLADAMDRVTKTRPDIPENTVIRAVEDAWQKNGELGVVELLQSLQVK